MKDNDTGPPTPGASEYQIKEAWKNLVKKGPQVFEQSAIIVPKGEDDSV